MCLLMSLLCGRKLRHEGLSAEVRLIRALGSRSRTCVKRAWGLDAVIVDEVYNESVRCYLWTRSLLRAFHNCKLPKNVVCI